MNQPPRQGRPRDKPPDWLRPRGVAPGTWAYANERAIADHYDAFVADTPLCETDQSILHEFFPPIRTTQATETIEKIIDLGCGSGRNAVDLAERGYSVVGVDLSQSMLEALRRKSDRNSQVSGVRANLVDLDCFADGAFDHAVCMFSTLGMIQGRKHRRRMLAHVARVVTPGGRFIFHVHHRWAALAEPGGWKRLAASWWRSKRTSDHDFGDATYAYRGIENMFMHRFSRREIIEDMSATGWSIDNIDCLSTDGGSIVKKPRIMSHRVGGFSIAARNL